MNKTILSLASVSVIVAASVFLAQRALPHPLPAPTPPAGDEDDFHPAISWSVPKISEILFPGTTKAVTVTFRSNQNISNAAVTVEPGDEVESKDDDSPQTPVFSVSPALFPTIVAHRDYQLHITLTAPPQFKKRSFGGTLHIRSSTRPPRTYATPLAYILRTDFHKYLLPGSTVSFAYPAGWTILPSDDSISLISPTRAALINLGNESDTPPNITLLILHPSASLDLSSFSKSYNDGWYRYYRSAIPGTIGGRSAITFTDIGAPLSHAPVVAIFIASSSSVALLTLNDPENPETVTDMTLLLSLANTLSF